MNRFLLAAMLCASTASAGPILDNFDDPGINTNLWNVLLPSGSAQVTVASGRAVLQARGGLSPASDYLCDVEVQGRFRFAGTADRFEVVLRSSLSFASSAGDRTGLSIFFDQTNNVIGLNEVGIGLLVSKRFIFHPNEDVTFKITDDGENVSIYVTNLTVPFLSDFSLIRTGGKIAFYNRDIAGAQTEIDFLQINSEERCPSIISHPKNVNTLEHSNAVFAVQATGLSPLSYQWYFNQGIIPGATAQTLLLTNVSLSQAGQYLVIVSNDFGSVASTAATLVLKPDTDGDGLSDEEENTFTNKYVIINGSYTWPQAKADAEARGGHLATFPTGAEWQFVLTNFGSTLVGLALGGTDEGTEGTWRWVTGEPWAFTYWLSGQPDNASGRQHYLRVHPGIFWDDNYVEVTGGYLLERENCSDATKADTDGDGLSDFDEVRIYRTLACNADTDGDGLTDYEEVMVYHTNPLLRDTDGDGLSDGDEVHLYHSNPLLVDSDGDGLSDRDEVLFYHTNPLSTDTDGDGLTDNEEIGTPSRFVIVPGSFTWSEAKTNAEARGGHLATFTSAAEWQFVYTNFGAPLQGLWIGGTDEGTEGNWRWVTGEPWTFTYWMQNEPDNAGGIQHFLRIHPGILWSDDYPYVRDGYLMELPYSDPTLADTDGDGLSDYDEVRIYKTSPSSVDTDGDGLTDYDEVMLYHTSPLKADTDGDKLSDFAEVTVHLTDPLKADTDGDGLSDGAEVLIHHTDPHKTDTDGDGFSDQTEVYTGKNPNDSSDYPTATLNIFPAVEVEIASRTGVTYQIQTSTNLQTWTNLDAPFTGDGQLFRKLYPARENPKLFYRVEVVAP